MLKSSSIAILAAFADLLTGTAAAAPLEYNRDVRPIL